MRKPSLVKTEEATSNASRKVRYNEAARILGMPVATLYALVHQKRVPHYRYGPRFVVFDLGELEQWLAQRRVAAANRIERPEAVSRTLGREPTTAETKPEE